MAEPNWCAECAKPFSPERDACPRCGGPPEVEVQRVKKLDAEKLRALAAEKQEARALGEIQQRIEAERARIAPAAPAPMPPIVVRAEPAEPARARRSSPDPITYEPKILAKKLYGYAWFLQASAMLLGAIAGGGPLLVTWLGDEGRGGRTAVLIFAGAGALMGAWAGFVLSYFMALLLRAAGQLLLAVARIEES